MAEVTFMKTTSGKIKDLPIIETVMRSIQQNSTVKTILKLGCSVLITYSRYRNQLIRYS